jgi:hypothetical protein
MINRLVEYRRRIVALAQGARRTGCHHRGNLPDPATDRAVEMTAEYGGHPTRGPQGLLQPCHGLGHHEIEGIRSDFDSERQMMHERRDRRGAFGVDQIDQNLDSLGTEIASVALRSHDVHRDQPDREVIHGIGEEPGARGTARPWHERPTQFFRSSRLPGTTSTGACARRSRPAANS